MCDDNEDCQDGSDEREGCALNHGMIFEFQLIEIIIPFLLLVLLN